MLNPVIEQQLTMDAPFAWVVWSKGRLSSRYSRSDLFFSERLNSYLQCLNSVMQAYFAADSHSDISYEAAIKSVTEAFPLSMCSEDCLRAQLDNDYKDISKCSDDSGL